MHRGRGQRCGTGRLSAYQNIPMRTTSITSQFRGYDVIYVSAHDMLTQLRSSRADTTHDRKMLRFTVNGVIELLMVESGWCISGLLLHRMGWSPWTSLRRTN